jgi:hypothetical protein
LLDWYKCTNTDCKISILIVILRMLSILKTANEKASKVSAAACIKLQTAACRYTLSLLYWYKSTNTDALRARRACRALCALAGDHKTSLLVLLVQKYKH